MWHYSWVVPSDPLVCELAHTPPLAYVAVRGRLDPHTAPVLRQAVLKALTAEPEAVLIDLADVTDVDPIALTVFLSLARAAAAWPGAQLIHHSAAPALARELEELAIGRHVPLAADRVAAEALAARGSGPVQVRWEVVGGVDGLAGARDVVRTFCLRHDLDSLSGNAELVITELAVNALVHGAAPVTAWASLRRRYLHLAVRDRSAVMPRLVGPGDSLGDGGRGLMIVEALTVAWGATAARDGKVVWCTLRP
jgi:anti-anti-sigma regulatory factor/anti-sigma regulatory factor (Ser/Thr protein kinase)